MANKFYNRKKRSNVTNNTDMLTSSLPGKEYTAEQLNLSITDLGISETTAELLNKYRISDAAELIKRTDKDMYKVQGLNKKILSEIKDSLAKNGMSLREEVRETDKVSRPSNESERSARSARGSGALNKQSVKTSAEKSVGKSEEIRNKFGVLKRENTDSGNVSDRNDPRGEHRGRENFSKGRTSFNKNENNKSDTFRNSRPPQKAESAKPEKLTQPLPLEQWRKVMKGGKWGFSDGFKITIPTMYDEVFCFKEGLASVELEEKCGYIDGENNLVIPFDYDTAMSFSEGLASVCKGEKFGYINKNNELILPYEYDAATAFEGGEAKVKKDGKWGSITLDGKITWI